MGVKRGVRVLSSGGLGVEGRGCRGVVDQWLMEAKQAAARGPSVVQEAAFRGRTVQANGHLTPIPHPPPTSSFEYAQQMRGREGEEIKTLSLFHSSSGAGWG